MILHTACYTYIIEYNSYLFSIMLSKYTNIMIKYNYVKNIKNFMLAVLGVKLL